MLIFGHACVLMFLFLISITLVCFSILNLLCGACMLSFWGFILSHFGMLWFCREEIKHLKREG